MGTIYIVMYATKRLPISDLQGSYLLTITGVVDLLTRIPFGFLAEYPWINRHYLLAFNVMNMGLACASYLLASTYPLAIAASVYYGLFCGLYGALSVSSLSDITKVISSFKFVLKQNSVNEMRSRFSDWTRNFLKFKWTQLYDCCAMSW